MASARKRKRLSAEERFKLAIDRFNVLDAIVKDSDRERKLLKKKLQNIIKQRGERGIFRGNHSLISARDAERKIIDQAKVLDAVGPEKFKKLFKRSKYIHLQGGSLSSPPRESAEEEDVEE
jgi:hypothetical protein